MKTKRRVMIYGEDEATMERSNGRRRKLEKVISDLLKFFTDLFWSFMNMQPSRTAVYRCMYTQERISEKLEKQTHQAEYNT
ncbi:hypothetical protein R6Q59_004238 [Mikania micrantha]